MLHLHTCQPSLVHSTRHPRFQTPPLKEVGGATSDRCGVSTLFEFAEFIGGGIVADAFLTFFVL
jgi:hypothetical protein